MKIKDEDVLLIPCPREQPGMLGSKHWRPWGREVWQGLGQGQGQGGHRCWPQLDEPENVRWQRQQKHGRDHVSGQGQWRDLMRPAEAEAEAGAGA